MTFEWDESKNLANFRKHGIWFEEAQTVWSDGHAAEFHDPEHSIPASRVLNPRENPARHFLREGR